MDNDNGIFLIQTHDLIGQMLSKYYNIDYDIICYYDISQKKYIMISVLTHDHPKFLRIYNKLSDIVESPQTKKIKYLQLQDSNDREKLNRFMNCIPKLSYEISLIHCINSTTPLDIPFLFKTEKIIKETYEILPTSNPETSTILASFITLSINNDMFFTEFMDKINSNSVKTLPSTNENLKHYMSQFYMDIIESKHMVNLDLTQISNIINSDYPDKKLPTPPPNINKNITVLSTKKLSEDIIVNIDSINISIDPSNYSNIFLEKYNKKQLIKIRHVLISDDKDKYEDLIDLIDKKLIDLTV